LTCRVIDFLPLFPFQTLRNSPYDGGQRGSSAAEALSRTIGVRMKLEDAVRASLLVIAGALTMAAPCGAQQLTNGKLTLTVNAQDGSYQVAENSGPLVLESRVAAQVDHHWLDSKDYPRCAASESTFNDALGSGHQVSVTCSGLQGKPDLVYVVQLYDQSRYGTVQVWVRNTTEKEVPVQAIRSVEAVGGA